MSACLALSLRRSMNLTIINITALLSGLEKIMIFKNKKIRSIFFYKFVFFALI